MLSFNVRIFLLLVIVVIPSCYAVCNVCQANGAECINSTSFHLCYGNKVPNYDKLYHCQAGLDCSAFTAICVQSVSGLTASCGDTSQCGICSASKNNLFACTSRSTFRLCYGSAQPKSILGYCPEGRVCDAKSDSMCVVPAEAKSITCDTVAPEGPAITTTSTEKTTATSGTPLTPQLVCDVEKRIGVYQIPGDVNCLNYITCYMQKGLIHGSLAECPTGTYFSGEALQCVLKKPLYCV